MKVILFGAGHVGHALAKQFVEDADIKKLMVCDRRGSALETLQTKLVSPKLRVLRIGMEQETQLKSVLKGYDLLINALPLRFSAKLTKLAIKCGVHYLDLGGNQETLEKQATYHDLAVSQKKLILPNCGFSPGLANIIAINQLQHFEHLHDIIIRSGCLPVAPIPPFNYKLVIAADALLEEYFEPQWAMRDGQACELKSLEGLNSLQFNSLEVPMPLEVFFTGNRIHSLTKSLTGRVDNVSYQAIRYQGHCNIIKSFALLNFDKRAIFDVRSQMTYRQLFERQMERNLTSDVLDMTLMQIEAVGTTNGQKQKRLLEFVIKQVDQMQESSLVDLTAFSTLLIAKHVSRSEYWNKGGFYSPEYLVDSKSFIQEIKNAGIELKEYKFDIS
jgi:lysine 6-dehydrogenase